LGFAFTEPLIYPHLVEAVGLATARGLSSAVTTNGLTLKSSAGELAAAGLDDLFLSLDGPPAIHDEIRGREGSFDRAVAGIEVLLAAEPRPRISVFCVITPWNQELLVAFLGVLSPLPLHQVGFMHPNFTPEDVVRTHNSTYGSSYPATTSNLGPFDPADMDLPSLAAELDAIERRSWPFPVSFSPNVRGAAALDRFYNRPAELLGRSCGDAFRALMIKSDGRVIPAHGRCYDVTVGNLHETSLPEIWNSAELGRFRKTLYRAGGLLPACSRCCSAF
jgi:MoaA/NifB/PqqE/SkfB family radical SAM enzyme